LTAPARDDVSEPRVGTKKRALRSNKETDEGQKICRSGELLDKKSPIQGNRGRCGEVARQTLRGFGGGESEYNFCDMARTLRMGENAFRRSCNFRELGVVKRAHITTFALCA